MATNTERERLEQVLLGQAGLMQEVHELLADEAHRDDVLRASLRGARKAVPVALRNPDPDRIYSLSTIRELCIRYRLRFLEGGLYKGGIPGQALYGMRQLEREVGEAVTSYMVMAPSAQFRLCDSEADPLLFVPLGNDRYYLVARWGNDLSPLRAAAFWVVRSPLHLAIAVLLAAVLLTAAIPSNLLGDAMLPVLNSKRILFLFWSTMVLSGFTLFGWFAFFGQFSKEAWNSRFFNG
jgi:hypothetical protein